MEKQMHAPAKVNLSLLTQIVAAFSNKEEIPCPYNDDPPGGSHTMMVPTEVRHLFAVHASLAQAALEATKEAVPRESRTWMWRTEERDALMIFICNHLQFMYGRNRSDRIDFYRNWRFAFTR
jgi:hypothetical protein